MLPLSPYCGHFLHVLEISTTDLNDICECQECRVTRVFAPGQFYDPDWWLRCLGIRNMQQPQTSVAHIEVIGRANLSNFQFQAFFQLKWKFFTVFFILLLITQLPQKCKLFIGRPGRQRITLTTPLPPLITAAKEVINPFLPLQTRHISSAPTLSWRIWHKLKALLHSQSYIEHFSWWLLTTDLTYYQSNCCLTLTPVARFMQPC